MSDPSNQVPGGTLYGRRGTEACQTETLILLQDCNEIIDQYAFVHTKVPLCLDRTPSSGHHPTG